MSMHSVSQLGGILPALVSPLHRDGEIDVEGTRRLIRHVLDGGVNGVLALGSTGESATLTRRQRRTLVDTVADEVGSRVPLVVGVAQVDLDSVRDELRAAASAGASAALVTPPYYAPPDQHAILDFYRRLAADDILPILIYNIPLYTKVSVEPKTVVQLAEEGTVAGMKDSSGNFSYHSRVLAETRGLPEFRLFMGNEGILLASLTMGGAGSICATANVAPRLLLDLVESARRGDLDSARAAQFAVIDLVSALVVGGLPLGFKAALDLLGVCQPWPAPPTQPLDPRHFDGLREALARHNLLPAAALV
jgi:4-hydroxy-tetrahydrodipicolinate synthase